MNWLTKAAKAFSTMRHPGRPGFFGGMLKRTRFDYRREIGDGLDSSVVTAPIRWVQRALPEARLAVKNRKSDGSLVEILDHPMLALIQRPNDFYGDIALWAGTLLSWYLDGNAYWMIVRNGAGRPAELWWIPHWMLEPKWPQDGSVFISHYRYSPGDGHVPVDVAFEDVVHFRDGINPRNNRKGLSALDGVIREIFVDLESSNFVASLLRNMGVPGVVISPKGGAMPAPDDVAATKAWFQESFSGDKRGGPLVMGAPTDVQAYGFNPQQMNMSEGRDVAEERVCAVIGIPAAVVGFGAGLQTAKVGATMQELHKIAWLNGVLPVGRALIDELKRSLLPLFGNAAGLDLCLDTSDVQALQEDEDDRVERWNKKLASGGITVKEYRLGIGLPADDSHDYYLRLISMIDVPVGQVRPALPAPAKGEKDDARASEAAYKRGNAFALLLEKQASGLQTTFETPLTSLFERLGASASAVALPMLTADPTLPVKSASRDEKADDALVALILDKLGIDEWDGELSDAYQAQYLEVAKAVSDAAERAGLGASLPDVVARSIVAAGGRRAGLVDLGSQTRSALFTALAEGRAEGEGATQLAARISDQVQGGPWKTAEMRARVIARTETKYAQNISTIERAMAAGVKSFIVFDGRLGPGRSQLSHIARNGSIVSAERAQQMAVSEHPNGTLSFAPNFEEN